MDNESESKFRIWWVINPPHKPIFTHVQNPEEGYKLLNEEINRQLGDPSIWGNAFGMESFEDGEWGEWYDDNGNNIFEHFEVEEE